MSKRIVALLTAGVLLASCGTQSPATAMKKWLAQSSFIANAKTLVSDATNADRTLRASTSTAAQLRTVCGVLLYETQGVNASLPSPDAQLSTLAATAFNTLGDGANECYKAGTSAALRSHALRYLHTGVADLYEAALRAHVVAGN